MMRAASDSVRGPSFSNSPRLSVADASSLPAGVGFGRDVGGWCDIVEGLSSLFFLIR